MLHYLFKRTLGGTAFYRHRATGFEYVDFARRPSYLACVDQESNGPHRPAAGYITGSTALYEQICAQEGIFNRLLMYRRNSLHSGNIAPDFVPIRIRAAATFHKRLSCSKRGNSSRLCPGFTLALAKSVAFLFCRRAAVCDPVRGQCPQ
jgi:hypothetical protein